MWNVIQTDEFGQWFERLDISAQTNIYEKMLILKEFGPKLGRPYVDTINNSKFKNMKELRVQSKNRPYRILFAFDPNRNAVLLIGGNKAGKKRFYDDIIKQADELFTKYLEDINET